jgi:hypothetical protein
MKNRVFIVISLLGLNRPWHRARVMPGIEKPGGSSRQTIARTLDLFVTLISSQQSSPPSLDNRLLF